MKTIFSANRKSLKAPEFIGVSLIYKQPDYRRYSSREYRARYCKDGGAIYAINIYPRNWPPKHKKT